MDVGDLLMSVQPADLPATVSTRPSVPGPQSNSSLEAALAAIAEFSRRLSNVEQQLSLTVSGPHIISSIVLSPEAIKIQSDKIAILGETTFADWMRDLNGTATGVIDPSITRIRGGTIQTERILSFDGLSFVDLDATGSSAFIQSTGSVQINANGTFDFGSGTGKHLIFNGTNLTLGGNALLNTTSVDTVVSGAASGAAYPGDFTENILENSGTVINVTSSQLFTMPGSGSGGVFIGAGGLFGKNSAGTTTFSVEASTGVIAAMQFNPNISVIFKGATTGYSARQEFYTSDNVLCAQALVFYGSFGQPLNTLVVEGANGHIPCWYGKVYNQSAGDAVERYVTGNDLVAGNSSGNVPTNNGTQNTNLYASYSADSALFAGLAYTTFVRMNQVDCQFSTDGGGVWNNVRFKP